ncbi:MAG: MerR family transcriptional regulator [Nocardioidaceae bacterium]
MANPRPGTAQGVYAISIAAEIVGTGVQNLRAYERHGLVAPSRSGGGTRLYSANDLDRLRRIVELLDRGLNIAGVTMVLELQDDNARLRNRLSRQKN